MNKISSFLVDHTKLEPGIYISMKGNGFVTYDLRITKPNREPTIPPKAIHTLEHFMATWFRNNKKLSNKVIYVGPMGCLTGMYLILTEEINIIKLKSLVEECLEWILEQKEIPGATPKECGNYLHHDLLFCKFVCNAYLDQLRNNFHSEYPKEDTDTNVDVVENHNNYYGMASNSKIDYINSLKY